MGRINEKLTKTEIEILKLIVIEELSIEDIADRMCLSIKAIRYHTEKIREIYGANSTLIAVVRFMKERGFEWKVKILNKNFPRA